MKWRLAGLLIVFLGVALWAQEGQDTFSLEGLKFRSIGPALTSGRIADLAVHPKDPCTYYVATASGGVWMTDNCGTTFRPVFDHYGSYSIGCIAISQRDPRILWVGTGENNNQRSVGYGDGVYKSVDGGKTWKNMGLKHSEHIGKIIIHPDDDSIVYVAAMGPLWSSGGDRGVYKTVDGGKHWERVLYIDEHTGVVDLVMDPRNPDVLYAAAFQRRRHVFTYLGGGPGSAIYKTTDGGKTWTKCTKGLPKGDIGRIGLAIAPSNPDYLYAIVEASGEEGGFYLSKDGGASWKRLSKYSTSGNYYQEIYVDPTNHLRIFAMDTWLHISEDGGRTFKRRQGKYVHVDNHCIWVNPDRPSHWRVGTDGGLYETFDDGATWKFFPNLPITQFYRVAVDSAYPFYHVYGGTQDNFTLGGPARTPSVHGILNRDWWVVHGGDGFEPAVDPHDPHIVYAQSQYGVLVRFDRRTGEEVGIQPLPDTAEYRYRWNWDAPLLVSRHNPRRLYFAANYVFRSDDRGNTWVKISPDLSRQLDRNRLKVMGKLWSVDAVAKHRSTSPYGAVVAFDESRWDEQVLLAGTDDGLLWLTLDGGQHWTKLPHPDGAPDTSYVSDVLLSRHHPQRMYVVFNHHKYGDFRPYIYRSDDGGKHWKKIVAGLPERGSVYCIIEDHVDEDLLFCGTEFGVYYSRNGGQYWNRLKTGLPTIAVRDIEIQEQGNDLVLATFGRGFYVLDDYSPLRQLDAIAPRDSFYLFAIRDAHRFVEDYPLGLRGKAFQGDQFYTGENLGPHVLIRYFVRFPYESLAEKRRKAEQTKRKKGEDIYHPSYEEYKREKDERAPELFVVITDSTGAVVRKIPAKWTSKGILQVKWDMRYPSTDPIRLKPFKTDNPFLSLPRGRLVAPGTYAAQLYLRTATRWYPVSASTQFKVINVDRYSVDPPNYPITSAFQAKIDSLNRIAGMLNKSLQEYHNQHQHILAALKQHNVVDVGLLHKADSLTQVYRQIRRQMYGDDIRRKLDLPDRMAPIERFQTIKWFEGGYSGNPLGYHRQQLQYVEDLFKGLQEQISKYAQSVQELNAKLEELQIPYTPGRKP